MKPYLLLFLCSFFLGSPAFSAGRGWDNGNAGDTIAAEFILTARDVASRLGMLPGSELKDIDMLALKGALDNTQVHSEETLTLNGYEVDAINHPDRGMIEISRSRWRALRQPSDTRQRLMLALHEYLFMIGVDDSQFVHSGRLIPLMDVKDYNPNRWWNPLNPANHIALNLEYAPNDCKIGPLNFDPASVSETASVETTGRCEDAYRKVVVIKSSYTAPAISNARGTFHRYELQVFDHDGKLLGLFSYEPEWGVCLLPQDGTCRLSGTMSAGGVGFIFWLSR